MTIILEQRPPESLIPNPHNARLHSKKQISQIAKSIASFGFLSPVLIDQQGTILAGHARAQAAVSLNLPFVSCVCVEHLTEAQKRAFIIADNKLAQNATWDERKLKQEFEALLAFDVEFDLTVTGFETGEIDFLILNSDSEDVSAEILTQPLPTSTLVKPGDVWNLGAHRILCANSLDENSFTILMKDQKAAMVITDPPYNVPIQGHVSSNAQHREFSMASGEMTSSQFVSFLETTIEHMIRSTQLGSIHFIFMDWRHMGEILQAGKLYTELKNLCVWVKDNGGMGSFYRSRHELVFVFRNGGDKNINNFGLGEMGRYRTNVWEYAGMNSLAGRKKLNDKELFHPTIKPLDLLKDAILDCSNHHDIILDPFLGSGSTLIAAHDVRRICYGIEIDPLYIDLTIRRFYKSTGIVAIRERDQVPFFESGQV